MTRPSDDLNDLTSDIAHLSTLIGVITNLAIDIISKDKEQCELTKKEIGEVTDLLWIARDMVKQLVKNGESCHDKVERLAPKTGGVE